MNIQITEFCIIIFLSLIIYMIACLLNKDTIKRIYSATLLISVTIYSGIGISDANMDSMYIVHFFLFELLLVLSMSIVFRNNITLNRNKIKSRFNAIDKSIDKYEKIYSVFSWIYLLSYIVYLIVPDNRIKLFFNPFSGQIDLVEILKQRGNTNSVWAIVTYLQLALQPFFLIYLYCLSKRKKYISIIMMYILWVYLRFLQNFYISRNEIVFYFIFFVIIISYTKHKKIYVSKKCILVIMITMMLMVPFFINYQNIRMGDTNRVSNYRPAIEELFNSECSYPKYYDIINDSNIIKPIDYWLYMLFLPVPTAIWHTKPTVFINEVFTYLILGVTRGQTGFYIVLPSILGEAFMIYGKSLFWIHAIVLGGIIGAIYKFLAKSRRYTFINLYYALLLLTLGRGGSQGVIPQAINGLIFVAIWELYIKINAKQNEVPYNTEH